MVVGELSLILGITTAVVGGVAYFIQNLSRRDTFFRDCSKSLYSTNPTEQITAAIMLRNYVKRISYAKRTKNLMVALLRTSIPVTLQKVIADVFSYARHLNGQDMQHINMIGALIKPKSRIKYELTKKKIYKYFRLSMKQADFYQAIIKDCSINNVNATKVVFYCSNLSGTSFRNCILNDANFMGANVKNVRFDDDCSLEGAIFDGAIGLEEAKVGSGQNAHSLIQRLDKNGVYHKKNTGGEYLRNSNEHKIFISKLGAMDSKQLERYDVITRTIKNVKWEQINREQYPVVSQLSDVLTHMEQCDGCVIFAFEYLYVTSGCLHKNIESEDRLPINEMSMISPWMHIEAALACCENMPCLIIYEKGLFLDGMFDAKIIDPDKNLFAIEYSDTMQPSNDIIQKWMNAVREYHVKRITK